MVVGDGVLSSFSSSLPCIKIIILFQYLLAQKDGKINGRMSNGVVVLWLLRLDHFLLAILSGVHNRSRYSFISGFR